MSGFIGVVSVGIGTLLAIPLLAVIQIIIDQIVQARDARYYQREAAKTPDGPAHTAADVSAELAEVRALLTSSEPLDPDEREKAIERLDDALRRLEPAPSAKAAASGRSKPTRSDDR